MRLCIIVAKIAHQINVWLSPLARQRTIWIVVLLTLASLIPRLLTYDRYLPYSDYTDESVYIALAEEARGLSDQSALREQYGLLAPLYVAFNGGIQAIVDALSPADWRIPVDYYYALRFTSVLFGVATTLLIAWTGSLLAGRWAGLIAGLVWALAHIVVSLNSLAIPDPMLYCLCILAVGAAVAAWQKLSLVWLIVSLLAGIAALYNKLWTVTAVLPFVMVSVLLILRDRKHWLPRIGVIYAAAALIAAHFLLVINPLGNTIKIQDNAGGGLFERMFTPDRMLNNLWHLHYPITVGNGWIVAFVLIGGAAAYVYLKRRGRGLSDVASVAIVGIYTVSAWILTGMISNVNIDPAGRMRHIFPAVVTLIPLWAAALVWIFRAIAHRWSRTQRLMRFAPAIVAAIMVVAAMPGIATLTRQYQRPHTIARAQAWFDSSPPRDGTVLMPADARVGDIWNRIWGAYGGSKPFDYLHRPLEAFVNFSPDELRAEGITWVVFGEAIVLRGTPPGWAEWLDTLMLVKTVASDAERRTSAGETVWIYRVDGMDQAADGVFGESLQLVGYDLRLEYGDLLPDSIAPGSTLMFRPYWRLNAPVTQPLSMFLHLYGQSDVDVGTPVVLAQVDTEPLHNTNRPPMTWTDPDELYFGNPVALGIPADLPAGEYVLALGVYDYTTGSRLALADGSTWVGVRIRVR